MSPKDVIKPQLNQSLLRQYQEAIWRNNPRESLPLFGMTVKEMSRLCNNAELRSPHAIWLMEQLNRIQKDAVCLYLQGSPAGSLIPHLQRKGLVLQAVKQLVAVASVAKESENTTCLSKKSGSHWVLVVVNLEGQGVYYCDPQAWGPPPDLLKTLQEFCHFFDCQVTADSLIFCHEPIPQSVGQHTCSSVCLSYPLLPQDSCASGVIILTSAVVSACDWEMFFNMISGTQSVCYLKQPTDYEAYLRKVLICWFMAGTIDFKNIQLKSEKDSDHQSSSSETVQSSTNVRSKSSEDLTGNAGGELPHDSEDYGTYAVETRKSSAAMAKKKKFTCKECHSQLGSRTALFKHEQSKHPEDHELRHAPGKSLLYCMDCGIRCYKLRTLIEHYKTEHDEQFSIQKKTFASEEEFFTWKEWVEKKTNAQFNQRAGKRFTTSSTIVRNFRCSRSKYDVSIRQESGEGGVACPAFIKSTKDRVSKKVEVEFCLDHVHEGHVHEHDVKYLRLSSDSQRMIAEKLRLGISIDTIVDEVQHNAQAMGRDNHISRTEVLCVKHSLNLDIDSSELSAYRAEFESTKKEALQTVEEVTSLIHASSSVDTLTNVLKHLENAVKAGKGILAISEDHDYQ